MSPRPYRLGQRQESVALTRERILAAARLLFSEAGFHEASLEEVARHADVARKTVYYQFGSKLGLLEAMVTEMERRGAIAEHVQQVVEQSRPARLLRDYFREVCRFWEAETGVMRTLIGVAAVDADARQVLESHDEARRKRLGGLVEGLIHQQRLRPGYSPKTAVDVLWLLSSFSTFDHLFGRSRIPADRVASLLSDLASTLLLGRGRRAYTD